MHNTQKTIHVCYFLDIIARFTRCFRNFVFIYSKIAQYLKAYKYVKGVGEGVLRDKILIHYVGSDKTGRWEIIQYF